MYSTKIRILSSQLGLLHKDFVRSIAVASSTAKLEGATTQLKSLKEIPGPSSLPIIGTLRHALPGGLFYNKSPTEVIQELHKIFGPIVRMEATLGVPLMIFLFDAECAAQVLRGENSMPIRPGFPSLDYYRKKYKNTNEQLATPTGLLTEHMKPWKEFRSTVNPVMLQPKTIRLYTTAIDQVAQDMIARMKSIRDENNMLRGKFDVEMNLWSLESIGVVALGTRLNCLDPNLPDNSEAKRLIQCVHDFFVIAKEMDRKPNIWKYITTPTYKKAMKLYEEQENLSKHFIQKAMRDLKENKGKSNDEKGVLEKLMEINEDIAHIMAADMLFAGVDTAANTMTSTLYLLAKNPEKQQKLREELLSNSEKRPYLRACIKEAMRIMPVVAGNVRMTTKEYNVLGYHIPKNTKVVFGHQEMAMMEKYYPNPTEYIPERWLVDKSDPFYHGNAHPFAHAPFGFGVRKCIGTRIAELEIETFLARVIENFSVEWFGLPPKVVPMSINYVMGPYNFIFKDAK